MTDTELPKQELLIKLLRMTTSDNDPEALAALRKANALLVSAGWDWERLIHSKIRIIEDPFKNLGTPSAPARAANGSGFARPQPQPQSAPVTPPKRTTTTWPLGIQPNRFANFCYCCGVEVLTNVGVIFKPIMHNARGSSEWKVACLPCNGTNTTPGCHVLDYPATRQKAKRGRHNLTDLA